MPIRGAICAWVSFACLRTSRGVTGAWTTAGPSPLAWASASLRDWIRSSPNVFMASPFGLP